MNLKPLGDRVIVKPLEEEEVTAAGIVLPDTAKEKKAEGQVIAVGNGEKIVKLGLKKGDKVLYGKYAGEEVKIGKEEYKILGHEDVLAVVE